MEEAAVSCRGPERIQLMKRWLAVLKEIEKVSGASFEDKERNSEQQAASDEAKDNSKKPSLVRKHIYALLPNPSLL